MKKRYASGNKGTLSKLNKDNSKQFGKAIEIMNSNTKENERQKAIFKTTENDWGLNDDVNEERYSGSDRD